MNWKTLFLVALSPWLMAPSCGNDFPGWDVEIWAGDPDKGAIVREQGGESISCTDPRFQDFAGVRYEDLRELREEVIPRCKEWESKGEWENRMRRTRGGR